MMKKLLLVLLSLALLATAAAAAGHPFKDAVPAATFPHDNPMKITELEARDFNITFFPIDNDVFGNAVHNAQIERRECIEPDGKEWCRLTVDPWCSFGAWQWNAFSIGGCMMHAWIYDPGCRLIGFKDEIKYAIEMTGIPSELKYMVMFKITGSRPPRMIYGDQDHHEWSSGWMLFYPRYPRGTMIWYYYRYFDCHRP